MSEPHDNDAYCPVCGLYKASAVTCESCEIEQHFEDEKTTDRMTCGDRAGEGEAGPDDPARKPSD